MFETFRVFHWVFKSMRHGGIRQCYNTRLCQVSKTAPTGEYLTTGSFMIRGKKNYLPPSHLIMGVGFLFRLDETSVGNHKNERRIKGTANILQEGETKNEENIIEEAEPEDEDNQSDDDEEDPFKSDIKIDYTSGVFPVVILRGLHQLLG